MTDRENLLYQFRRYDPSADQWTGTDLAERPHLFARSKEDGFLIGTPVYDQPKAKESSDYLLTAMKDGQVIWTASAYAHGLLGIAAIADCSGLWVLGGNDRLLLLDREGNPVGNLSLPGEIRCFLPEENLLRIIGKGWYRELDENGILRKNDDWEKATANLNKTLFPAPGYSFCYATADSLMVCDIPSGRVTPLLHWAECGLAFTGGIPDSILFLSPEKLYVYGNSDGQQNLYLLTRNDAARPDREIVRITYMEDGSYSLPKAAAAFNALQEEYMVHCTRYESSARTLGEILGELDKMILEGTVGDIIQLNDINDLYKYADKGLLADLYSLDEACLAADNLMGCVKRSLEIDGCLYALPRSYRLDTLCARSSRINDRPLWTTDAMIALSDSLSDEEVLFSQGRSDVIPLLQEGVISGFLDRDHASCSFDTPEFVRYLEFLSSLPENGTPGKQQQLIPVMGIDDSRREHYRQQLGEEVTDIGFPTPEGGKTRLYAYNYYGINADTAVMEGARAFLVFLLRDSAAGNSPLKSVRTEAGLDVSAEDVVPVYACVPREILDIAEEEINTFFGGGQSAENTARYIQNRVSTYLSEQS